MEPDYVSILYFEIIDLLYVSISALFMLSLVLVESVSSTILNAFTPPHLVYSMQKPYVVVPAWSIYQRR